jgi:coenzyme F420-reducing hydrogenase alpha subunit
MSDMSKKILLKKATRIEGNADIHIELENGRIKAARFMVEDFRGFEKFAQGKRVEFIPHLVSRICGLCSAAHQVASLKAIEDALGLEVPNSLDFLREIIVLGEWISSHALSYFFLSMPDFVGAAGGIFELMNTHPEITGEAFALRKAGQRIVQLLGKRAAHPVALGIGRFHIPPTATELEEVRTIAEDIKQRTSKLISQTDKTLLKQKNLVFPPDQEVLFLAYDRRSGQDVFRAFSRSGEVRGSFSRSEFEENISEMRAEWTFAKFPYLRRFGFPAGIVLVGPLSRSYQEGGFLDEPELAPFDCVHLLQDRASIALESYDFCRLLEIFWAAVRIIQFLDEVDLRKISVDVDFKVSGKGVGVLEAPRGVLVHSYLVNRGCLERMRLLVATQFNNAYINLLLKDLAESHLENGLISEEGERLIGRCVRIFDPCLSCATH